MQEINNLRKTKNFPSKEYRTYLKKKYKETNEEIYKLELNTTKYYMLGSKSYLKKNIKLSQNHNKKEYLKYTKAILTQEINSLIEVRNILINYSIFVSEIDSILEKLNYEISNLKIKHKWNDLEIYFTTEEQKRKFESGELIGYDSKYDTNILKYIIELEKKYHQLINLISNNPIRVGCILKKISKFENVTVEFLKYLEYNFVKSEYLCALLKDTKILKKIYSDYEKCARCEVEGVEVEVPLLFKEVEEKVKEGRKAKLDYKKIRENILLSIKEEFIPKETEGKVPFLPEFYDLAYDYILYPPVDHQ